MNPRDAVAAPPGARRGPLAPWIDLPPRARAAAVAPDGGTQPGAAYSVPLVFLHNGFDSARTWVCVVRELDRSGAHPRLLAWDRYGAGEWPWPAEAQLRIPDDLIARDCEELEQRLDALGIERCVLVGHCIGGAVATRFAALHGDRCAGLHLTATGLYSTPALRDRVHWLLMPWGELPNGAREHLVAMHGSDKAQRLWDLIVNRWAGYVADPGYDLRPLLARVRCPVRYLLGERDVYFDHHHAEPGLQVLDTGGGVPLSFTIWPGVGHDVHREQTAAFAADVLRFVTELVARQPAREGLSRDTKRPPESHRRDPVPPKAAT